MNKNEYNEMMAPSVSPTLISVQNLYNKQDRTLLYGYTCDRLTWHVYLKNNIIYTVMYAYKEHPEPITITSNYGFVPDKRLYPARCDYEFCKLLDALDVSLPFTTFEEVELENGSIYYGEVLPEHV